MSIETQTTNGNNQLFEIGSAQIILKSKQDASLAKEVGFARAVSFTYEQQVIEVLADNGDVGLKGFTGSKAAINFTLLENDINLMKAVLGSAVEIDEEPGSDVKNITETFSLTNYNSNYCVNLINAPSSLEEPTNLLVRIVDSFDGSTIKTLNKITAINTEGYFVYKSSLGYYAICISGDILVNNFKLQVTYDITPPKSRSMIIKETGFFPELYLILKTRMYDGLLGSSHTKEYHFPKVKFNGSLAATFKSKREGDFVKEIPMVFQALPDQVIKSSGDIVTAVCIEKELLA